MIYIFYAFSESNGTCQSQNTHVKLNRKIVFCQTPNPRGSTTASNVKTVESRSGMTSICEPMKNGIGLDEFVIRESAFREGKLFGVRISMGNLSVKN